MSLSALTLWRPWAAAIAHGTKRIENRTWVPPRSMFGQDIAIHAGQRLDADAIEDVAADGVARGPLTPSTATMWVGLVGQVWEWASQSDAFADVVGPPRMPSMPRRAPAARRAAPSWADIDALLAECSRLEWLRRLVLVLRCTGLRVSQGIALDWSDVDLEARTLMVRTGKSRQEGAGRVVPLAPVLAREMAGWGRREGRVCGGSRVNSIGQITGGARHAIGRRWPRVELTREVREAVDAQPFHSIRRAFVSGLRAAGVDDEVRGALVGHAVGLTSDTYTTTSALWPAMVDAVAKVPEVAPAAVGFETRRVRSVSASK